MARRKKNKNLKGIPAAIMLILALIGGFAERGNLMERMSGEPVQNIADTVATGQMKVTYLNVGQGDCTIIQTEGHNAMIDAGNNHEGKDVVDYLNQQGIDKLDYLILTHPDADHIGGGDDVLEKNLKGIPAAIMLILALIGGFAERGNLMERMSGEPVQNIADTVATGQMKVTYLNVGQGDCTIIQTEGHNAMIDAGNNHEGKDVVDYLNQQGIDKLDYLILTHPDADHIGGGDDVLEKIEVEQVIMPDVANDTMTYEEVMDDIEKENVPVEHPKVGEEFGFGDATFTVFCPETDLVSSDDTNDASVGIELVHGENSFVMCGDASEKSESAMVKRFGSALECDVLKCGHHGSRTSTSEVFLKATNPTWAVISCGVDNSYGHPHQETLERLNNDDVQVYRTDLLGTIIATSDGTNISWFSEKE